MQMTNSYTFSVDKSLLRLDQYLSMKLPDISRSKIQHHIKMGQVKIDGKLVKSSFMLKGNEVIECCFNDKDIDISFQPEEMDLDILYEDDYLAVINKPSGLVVHPGNGNYSGTLLNGLLSHFNNLSMMGSARPGIVHRLDKDTSGVMLIAKKDHIHEGLNRQFRNHRVKKEYKALVWGKIPEGGTIDEKITRHPKDRKLFSVSSSSGRQSYTDYKLDECFPPISIVDLFPKTGRTHQLRVHLKFIGHPIFGDVNYGGGMKNAKSFHVKYTQILNRLGKVMPRVSLHAKSIKIQHPKLKETMEFVAPLPQDFNQAINLLRNGK